MFLLNSYKKNIFLYILLFLIVASPVLFLNEVIAPTRQYNELAATDIEIHSKHAENLKFSDYPRFYIPEIWQSINCPRSSWLGLWTDNNELGRPLYQNTGFTAAYFPTWIILKFTKDPWKIISWLSLLVCFFSGVFMFLFCRENAINPFAALISSISLSTIPFFMYWLTFPMFIATFCWTTAALWSIVRLHKKPDILGWSILAFSIYSLLIIGYPQVIVFQGYILAGYGLYLMYCKYRLKQSKIQMLQFLGYSISAVLVGLSLVLPIYIDLLHVAMESVRVTLSPSFFLYFLPKLGSAIDFVQFFLLVTIPEIFGNPIAANYPFVYDGISVTPVIIFFIFICLVTSFWKVWGWILASVIIFLFTFIPFLYLFGVKYLGFNLSPINPLGNALLPLMIIASYGADALLTRSNPRIISRAILVAVAGILAILVIGVSFSFYQGLAIKWSIVLTVGLLTILLSMQYRKTHLTLLVTSIIIVTVSISFPLILRQSPIYIVKTSSLVKKIQANLPMGSRFAITAPEVSVLSPNINATLGLPSLHTYNSLYSKKYHELVNLLGGQTSQTITPNYNSTIFWMSNVGLILSSKKIINENLKYVDKESGVYIHKVISRMGDALQVPFSKNILNDNGIKLTDPKLLSGYAASKKLDQGDVSVFRVVKMRPSVLILSKKYDNNWKAKVLVNFTWAPAKTILVNNIFQGVLLPEDAQEVKLEFKPYARYAWIAHVFWILLLIRIGIMIWRKIEKSYNLFHKTGVSIK
jgi:hypothetical protein